VRGACAAFSKAVFEKKFYMALIKQIVPVFVDVTPGARNEKLLEKYGIDVSKDSPRSSSSTRAHRGRGGEEREVAAVAKNGPEAVQEWLLGLFQKDE